MLQTFRLEILHFVVNVENFVLQNKLRSNSDFSKLVQ